MTNQRSTQRLVEQGAATDIADTQGHRLRALVRRTAGSAHYLAAEPSSAAFETWASELGHLVPDRGIETVEPAIVAVCTSARRRRLEPTCVDILADRRQPAVARERALGRVLTALNASRTSAATIEVVSPASSRRRRSTGSHCEGDQQEQPSNPVRRH